MDGHGLQGRGQRRIGGREDGTVLQVAAVGAADQVPAQSLPGGPGRVRDGAAAGTGLEDDGRAVRDLRPGGQILPVRGVGRVEHARYEHARAGIRGQADPVDDLGLAARKHVAEQGTHVRTAALSSDFKHSKR